MTDERDIPKKHANCNILVQPIAVGYQYHGYFHNNLKGKSTQKLDFGILVLVSS
jgi:hypothetical protein